MGLQGAVYAEGCLKGAAVGGVVGHFAGNTPLSVVRQDARSARTRLKRKTKKNRRKKKKSRSKRSNGSNNHSQHSRLNNPICLRRSEYSVHDPQKIPICRQTFCR
jgi:hypothetical protein